MPNTCVTAFEGLSGAMFSPCGKYRYVLWRRWGGLLLDPNNMCAFIGLNPSTADAYANDPTVRRCIGFAKAWGFSGMYMLNAFAYRATDPEDMRAAKSPVGENNDTYIWGVALAAARVVLCWGVHGAHTGHVAARMRLIAPGRGKTTPPRENGHGTAATPALPSRRCRTATMGGLI